MKNLILLIAAIIIGTVSAYAQNGEGRKLTKKERKAMEARMDSLMHATAEKAVDDTAFVLEADRVTFKRGYTAHVTPTTNFIAVCGGEAAVQVAFNVPWPGFNGLGGITVEGDISKYKKTKDKKGNVYIEMSVNGRAISARLFVTLWKEGNKASVTVQQNFHSGKITLEGTIVPVEASSVYKATPL